MAERAARAGGTVARQAFRTDLTVDTKADETDLVTETDRDAQRQAISTIREEFPEDAIVAEEDALPTGVDESDAGLADSIPDRGDAWVIDPIDGTTNFVHGLTLWATSVAAVVDGDPVGAATYLPAFGEVYAGGLESATRDGTTLAVSEAIDPETFTVGVLGRPPTDTTELGDLFAGLSDALGDTRRFGSAQATLAFLADGGLDAVVATESMAPWDTLAGVRLVRTAGGTVTDLDGDPWSRTDGVFVASNGQAHEAVLAAANR
jgi:myo-inositol-1(or 4)-monophosphatase